MNIDIKDTITLSDNNEYVVISKVNYQDKIYYYLLGINDSANVKFCYEKTENHSVIEIDDKELVRTLLPLFVETTKEELKDINFEELLKNNQ